MTREIRCKDCGKRVIKDYPGEGTTKKWGNLKGSALCDWCNKQLNPGDEVCALSMYRDGGYFPWESDYLKDYVNG